MEFTKYVNLSDKTFDEIAILIRKSYPYSCVLWIQKIDNPSLTKQFEKYQEDLENPYELVDLFHGTKAKYIQNIVKNGLLSNNNRRSAFGIGTYASPNCSIAMQYTDGNVSNTEISYVFLCRCVVGSKSVAGNQSIVTTDCSVNSLTNPSIYCFPKDEAVLPVYSIAFHANPK